MGRKAKLKKERQQKAGKTDAKYDRTQFVKQFERMGYKLKTQKLSQNHLNAEISPEIPQDRVEPKL